MNGENWSALSIWIDQHISNPLTHAHIGWFIILAFFICWCWTMDDFGKSGIAYVQKRTKK